MDLTTLLDETAPTISAPSDTTLRRARAALDTQVRVSQLHVATARRSRRRRTGLVALVSVAAAGALVVAPTVGLGGHAPQDSAQAAAVLVAAGAAAAGQPDTVDAPFWHVDLEFAYAGKEPLRTQLWIDHDGIARVQNEELQAEPRAVPGDDGVYTSSFAGSSLDDGRTTDWAGIAALPTDPAALEALLRARIGQDRGPTPDVELWSVVTGLLSGAPATPALRAALWEVAAAVPGVELVGTTTDHAGRTGTAVELDQTGIGWYRERLILDPADGRLLEQVAFDASGAVDHWSTYLEQGPAQSAPDIDPPLCGPGSGVSC
ncbi:CU044_5270 family protein [Cellulomonas composti]|uniref:Uncharacterized protein n=1 Tax=Cellulomonas composti TaxID=266130 RepID=A0A511J8F9_9CELL|nr:CU044_5270 family protein [Cellulomonas composti]GEL94003.1 hypothetical protein CCO02nite_06610 [Cellulomonas composti]